MFDYDFSREIKLCAIYYVVTIAKSAIAVRGVLCCKDVEIIIFFLPYRILLTKSRSTSSLYQPIINKEPLPSKKTQVNNENQDKSNKSSLNKKPKLPTKPDFQFPMPPLRRVDKKQPAKNSNKTVELEEGIKLVTKESIENIRQSGGESFSFNFKKAELNVSSKPYLPQKKVISDAVDAIPVGVIKPITRKNEEKQSLSAKTQQQTTNKATSKKVVKAPGVGSDQSPRTTLNNLINLSKENTSAKDTSTPPAIAPKKEVLVIDKKPPPAPPSAVVETTNSNTVPPKVVTFADAIEVEKPPSPSKIVDEGIEDLEMMENNKSANYRESWKKHRDAENNTMVFNFLNTQKDVTHIENDGLDLSQRKKNKHHLNRIAKVRQRTFFVFSFLAQCSLG